MTLPIHNTHLLDIRREIDEAIREADLESTSRLGEVKVLFATLGRLPNPPRREGERFPLLDAISELNSQIPEALEAKINNLDVISTTQRGYVSPEDHAYFSPPIPLTDPKQTPTGLTIVRASKRIRQH